MSIAGGLPRAVDRAQASRCEALQIFTKSAGQWRARPLPPEEIALFRRRVAETGIRAGRRAQQLPDQPRHRPARAAGAVDRLAPARSSIAPKLLGLDGLVMHPGSYTSGTEQRWPAADRRSASRSCSTSARRGTTKILLEHTAGQGTNLGHRFEHLAEIIERLGGTPRVGVCLDTCHLLTAGYDLCTPGGLRRTFRGLRPDRRHSIASRRFT